MTVIKSSTTNQPSLVISVIYCSMLYQLPFILTAALPDKRGLLHGMCLYQAMVTLRFLNDVASFDIKFTCTRLGFENAC